VRASSKSEQRPQLCDLDRGETPQVYVLLQGLPVVTWSGELGKLTH